MAMEQSYYAKGDQAMRSVGDLTALAAEFKEVRENVSEGFQNVLMGVTNASGNLPGSVSLPAYITNNEEYDRNPSLCILQFQDEYWLFYTKANVGGVRGAGGYDPDAQGYTVYYKKADSLEGLVSATETKLAKSETHRPDAQFDQRVVSAVVFDGKIYAFVSSGLGSGWPTHGVYAYAFDGNGWSDPVTIISATDPHQYTAHINAVTDGSTIWIVGSNSGDSYIFQADPVTGSHSNWVQISTDNFPKIALEPTSGDLYVVAFDAAGINLRKSTDSGATWGAATQAIATTSVYDPAIFIHGGDLYVLAAPYDSGTDRQNIVITKSTDGLVGATWSPHAQVSDGQYGATTWWDYWPLGYSDGTDIYIYFGSERDGITLSDAEIVYYKVTWDVTKDHYEFLDRFMTESGPTTARPNAPVTGKFFLDTTLGKPVWYDGTQWIDATGAAV